MRDLRTVDARPMPGQPLAFKGEAVVLPFPPQEELTPEGIQLVIPGCTREDPPVKKQMELW